MAYDEAERDAVPLEILTMQFIGTPANAIVLVDAFRGVGLDAHYNAVASTRGAINVVEVGILTVHGAAALDDPARAALNRVLQGVPLGEIGVSRITPDTRGLVRDHEADLHAFLHRPRFSARLRFKMADREPNHTEEHAP